MNKLLIISIGVFTLIGCHNSVEGDCPKNVPLSTKEVHLASAPDSATITTGENKNWWLNEIVADGVELYDFDGLDVASNNYSIKVDSLTFERIEGTTIVLKVGQNVESRSKSFSVVLQDGNCFNYISITQDAQ